MREYLYETARKMDIDISERQLEQFQIYYDYLLKVNQFMNLTAITEEKEVVLKHFIDSISFLNYFEVFDDMRVIDVGTGAGFPGIPLAIMYPNVSFTLMDSLNKRIEFLKEVADLCKLENVWCIHGRAEELGNNMEHREQYDFCVSRAVANLSILLEYCIPFVKVGGKFVSYKSILAKDELLLSSHAQNVLSCYLKRNITFCIPDTDYQRCLLIFEKKNKLNVSYPRQNGIPKKKPL